MDLTFSISIHWKVATLGIVQLIGQFRSINKGQAINGWDVYKYFPLCLYLYTPLFYTFL